MCEAKHLLPIYTLVAWTGTVLINELGGSSRMQEERSSVLTHRLNSRGFAQNDRSNCRVNSYLLSLSVTYAIGDGS
jgi:hypothetical protein